MYKSIKLTMLLIILFFSFISPISTNRQSNDSEVHNFENLQYNSTKSYNLEIVFLGFQEDQIDTELIIDESITTHKPTPFWTFIAHSRLGMNPFELLRYEYDISYNFKFINDEKYDNFRNHMFNIATISDAPSFSDYNQVHYIPTEQVESYLINEGIVNQYQATMVIIDLFSSDPDTFEPHFYSLSTNDLDTIGKYKIADGGAISNTIWLDLSAGPSEYLTGTEGEVTAENIPPIWTYENETEELHEDLGDYIQTAIELKFLQSSPFETKFTFQNIKFKVGIYPSAIGDSLSFMESEDWDKFIQEIKKYNPFATYSYEMFEFDFNEDKYATLRDQVEASYDPGTNSYDYRDFTQHLTQNYQSHFNLNEENSEIVIPIYLFNTGNRNLGANGLALNNAEGEFTFVFFRPLHRTQLAAFANETLRTMANQKTLVHEIVHALGLSHPFDGYSFSHYSYRTPTYYKYWLWDYTTSYMSYLGLNLHTSIIDISAIRQRMLARFDYQFVEKFNNFLNYYNSLDTSSIDDTRLQSVNNELEQTLNYYEDSITQFNNGYLDTYNNSLENMFLAYTALTNVGAILNPTVESSEASEDYFLIFQINHLVTFTIITIYISRKNIKL